MSSPPKTICLNFPKFLLIAFLTVLFSFFTQAQKQENAKLKNCWKYSAKETEQLKIASDNVIQMTAYISFANGKIAALDPKVLIKDWETELPGVITSELLVDTDSIYTAARKTEYQELDKDQGNSNTTLYALSKTTGITRWHTRFNFSGSLYLYEFGENVILAASNGDVYSIAKLDGTLNWKRNLENAISSLALENAGILTVGTVDKKLISLALENGQLTRLLETAAPPTAIFADSTGKNLIIGDKKGIVQSLSKSGKTRNWTFRRGAGVSSITLTERGLLIASLDNFLYLISETHGELIWKKRLPGRIAAKPRIGNNYLLVTSIDDPTVLLVETSSGKTLNKVSLEGGDFFTGESARAGDFFIYSTHEGLLAFSLGDSGCP